MDRTDMMHRMYDIKGPLVAKKFAARGFEAVYCPTKEEAFMNLTKANGISGIKGHRSVGGFRASIYNAMPQSSIQVLVDLMQEFERTNG